MAQAGGSPARFSRSSYSHGNKDGLLKQGEEFMAKSKEVGHKADIILADGVGHGFFNSSP
jgi:acetyl esterase/lipase